MSGEPASWRIAVFQAFVRNGLIAVGRLNDGHLIDYDYHKSWSNPVNLRLQAFGAGDFEYTPYSQDSEREKAGAYRTYYKVVTGPDTAFDDAIPRSLKELPPSLILLVRVERSNTHWMQPGDLSIMELSNAEKARELLSGNSGYAVLFSDGQAWVLSADTPYLRLQHFFTITNAQTVNRDEALGPYRVFPR